MAYRTLIRNNTDGPLGLSWPYKLTCPTGGGIVVPHSVAATLSNLGGAEQIGEDLSLVELPATTDYPAGVVILYSDLKALLGTADSALDMNGQKITNAGTPTGATDLTTKGYVDSLLAAFGGLYVASVAALAAVTTATEAQLRVVVADATGNRAVYAYSAASTETPDGDEIVAGTGMGAGNWYKVADDESRSLRVLSVGGLAKNRAFAVTSYDTATKAWKIVAANCTNPALVAWGVLGVALGAGGTTIVSDDFILVASGLDTSLSAEGASVFFDATGALTLVNPATGVPSAYAQEVAKVSTLAAGGGGTLRVRACAVRPLINVLVDGSFAGSTVGRMRRTGAGTYDVVKDKLDATVDPTPANDTTEGYVIGSLMFNTLTSAWFQADAVGAGVAKWSPIAEPMVINKTGGALALGLVVALSGYDVTTGLRTIVHADSSDPTKPACGVLGASLAPNGTIPLRRVFLLASSGVDTTGGVIAVGDPVFYSAGGVLQVAKPNQPANQQVVARVVNINASADLLVCIQPQTGWQGLPLFAWRNGAPAAGDDNTCGFAVGSMWWDYTAGILYVAKTVGTGTADWIGSVVVAAAVTATNGGAPNQGKLVKLDGAGTLDGRDFHAKFNTGADAANYAIGGVVPGFALVYDIAVADADGDSDLILPAGMKVRVVDCSFKKDANPSGTAAGAFTVTLQKGATPITNAMVMPPAGGVCVAKRVLRPETIDPAQTTLTGAADTLRVHTTNTDGGTKHDAGIMTVVCVPTA